MSLEEHVIDLNERLTAQESHYEGIRAAIFELRRDLASRLSISTREADIVSLRQRLEQRIDDLEKTVANGLAEVHRSLQMVLDRRDITLLQRSVNETMKKVQALEAGQQELRGEVQELRGEVQELRGQVQELRNGQTRIEQTLQQILAKLG
jgi:chromosome segregation ATPase